jgi:hypothetical protein
MCIKKKKKDLPQNVFKLGARASAYESRARYMTQFIKGTAILYEKIRCRKSNEFLKII